jgi:hypothetical protein
MADGLVDTGQRRPFGGLIVACTIGIRALMEGKAEG